jgi:hypothetical protein
MKKIREEPRTSFIGAFQSLRGGPPQQCCRGLVVQIRSILPVRVNHFKINSTRLSHSNLKHQHNVHHHSSSIVTHHVILVMFTMAASLGLDARVCNCAQESARKAARRLHVSTTLSPASVSMHFRQMNTTKHFPSVQQKGVVTDHMSAVGSRLCNSREPGCCLVIRAMTCHT